MYINGFELVLIGGFSIGISLIAYKIFIHDEFIAKRNTPYKMPELDRLKDHLLSGIAKKAKKGSSLKFGLIG
jgi:hypothetical protein